MAAGGKDRYVIGGRGLCEKEKGIPSTDGMFNFLVFEFLNVASILLFIHFGCEMKSKRRKM